MRFTIYHPATHRLYQGERGRGSASGHTFGSADPYAGLDALAGPPPVHVLLRLDLADTAVGLTPPGVRYLPLLCAIRYGACALGYRVASDAEVLLFRQEETKPWDDFPYAGFPESIPVEPVALTEIPYRPDVPRDVLRHAGVFGLDHLTPDQFAACVRFAVDEGVYDPSFMDLEWGTPEEFLREGWGVPFMQGHPVEDCPDPACPNHGRAASLETFAIFLEAEQRRRDLWGPHGGDIQVIWQVCPLCHAVQATNQCT